MEQNHKVKKTADPRFPFRYAACLILIVLTAAAIWYGIHPRYRILSVGMLLLGALGLWKRNWMYGITLAVELAAVLFLWTFPQSGYRIASMVPLAVILMILIFRFGKKPLRILCSVLVSLTAAAILLVEIPIIRAASARPKEDVPYIIVLGAGVYGTTPSITLQHRLEGACRYLSDHPGTRAVVSGGQGKGEDITEAECMRIYLTEKGIEPDRILTEPRSTSTKENLAFSKAVIEENGGSAASVGIVSSGYHLYRAKLIASQLGMDAIGIPGSDGYPIYMFGMYLREAAAVLKTWVFGA